MSGGWFGRWIWHPVKHKGWWHWMIFATLMVLGYFAGLWLEKSPSLTGARYWMYRYQLRLQRQAPSRPYQTAVVLIEDQDYWSEPFAGRSPVDRTQLARLLTLLGQDGVQTIALDIDLRSPDALCAGCDFTRYHEEDQALDVAIKQLCHDGRWLVLGTSVRFEDGEYVQVPSLYTWAKQHGPAADYGCLLPGYLQLPHDLRQFPGALTLADGKPLDSFAMAAEKTLAEDKYRTAAQAPDRAFRFSRYLSEADYGADRGPFLFSVASLEALHQRDPNAVRRLLAQRVVLIGGAWHSTAIGQGARVDQYESPTGLVPGVFLHANYIEALNSDSGTFAPLPDWALKLFEYSLAGMLTLIGIQEIHPGWKWLSFFASILICFVLTYLLIENLGIFMDFLIPLCLMIVHTLVEEVIAWRRELHELRQRLEERHHAERVG
jgi:CHASE2 domain-containing sensor protein